VVPLATPLNQVTGTDEMQQLFLFLEFGAVLPYLCGLSGNTWWEEEKNRKPRNSCNTFVFNRLRDPTGGFFSA
jgi:hypothetical protein